MCVAGKWKIGLFIRDGVGESQIPFVHAHEVKQILKVISDVSPGTMLTFIIVSKRIQSRYNYPFKIDWDLFKFSSIHLEGF